MKNIVTLIAMISFLLVSAQEITFNDAALSDVFLAENGTEISFSEVLETHKEKTILIDIWANWCRDCIVGMPDVKKLQKRHEDVVFVFLSLDKSEAAWRAGIEKYQLEGAHYFLPKGWKSPFCASIDLDWIPRYMIVNPEGEISLYKAVKATDKKIKKTLSK